VTTWATAATTGFCLIRFSTDEDADGPVTTTGLGVCCCCDWLGVLRPRALAIVVDLEVRWLVVNEPLNKDCYIRNFIYYYLSMIVFVFLQLSGAYS
jgi:hypothetical protein